MNVKQKMKAALQLAQLRLAAPVLPAWAAARAFHLFCTPLSRKILEPTPLFAAADVQQFLFEDKKISGYRWNKGARQRYLILHGYESTVNNFETIISLLVAAGHEVMAFDAPAHGRSEGRHINALIYRDFVKHLISRFGPFSGAVAHSFGGLALSLALAEADHDPEFRAVLIGPVTQTSSSVRLFLHHIRSRQPRVEKAFHKIVTDISGQDISWFSIPRTLTAIKATILWIHDEEDNITPYADIIPVMQSQPEGIQFMITRGLGHRKIYRDQEVGKTIASFLQ